MCPSSTDACAAIKAAEAATREAGKAVREAADCAVLAVGAARTAESAALDAVQSAQPANLSDITPEKIRLASEAAGPPEVIAESAARQAMGSLGSHPGVNEFYALAPSVLLAAVLLWPGETFDSGQLFFGHKFWAENSFWTENYWAALHLFCVALGCIGRAMHGIALRRAAMLLSVCLWGVNTALFVGSNPLSFGWVCLVHIVAGAAAYIQLGGERAVNKARDTIRSKADGGSPGDR